MEVIPPSGACQISRKAEKWEQGEGSNRQKKTPKEEKEAKDLHNSQKNKMAGSPDLK